ncbi:MAG TPA: DinB family protein [Cyclobacteriaceae bacterium]|jgi:hypothetical protein|nr:DinB family protein [Cyclobacteriaceae bacterium]
MIIDDFNNTIDTWINDLERYTLDELCARSDPQGWSLGQVYMHLIEETKYYMEQMESCLKYNENAFEQMDDRGKVMFANNSFPDRRFKGDPFISEKVPQPASKSQLQKDMFQLKVEVNEIGNKVVSSDTIGKTPHPGHGYFSAREWLQYAEMHMRHHLKQKSRLEGLLAGA